MHCSQQYHNIILDKYIGFEVRSLLQASVTTLTTRFLSDSCECCTCTGQETTSHALAFLLNEVGRRPELLQR